MHQLKIVHRDIKSDNIMYSPTYKKNVLIDFGGCDFIA
jgi:serine/threonine protein kinase